MDRKQRGKTSPDAGRTSGRSVRQARVAERAALEERIAAVAAGQHGLITLVQLRAAGLGTQGVRYRLETKRLHAVQRGVYRVGPLLSAREREMAAVLACGPEAAASHRTAAGLWGLLRPPDTSAPVDVTVRSAHRRRPPGVRPHRSPRLEPDEVTSAEAIPVTTAARTLLDLAATVSPAELEEALARAERHELTNPVELEALMQRHRRIRGTRRLRALLGAGASLTRSEAEKRCRELIRKAQLPAPATNRRALGHEVDLLWPAQRVVVEVDGFAFHSSAGSFEQDRRRDARLVAAGFTVMRVTWRQIVREPEAVVARLAQALARAKSRP